MSLRKGSSSGELKYATKFRKHLVKNMKCFINMFGLSLTDLSMSKKKITSSLSEDHEILFSEHFADDLEMVRQKDIFKKTKRTIK